MRKKFGLGLYLGAAAAVALGLFTSVAAADTVKIGAVLSVTGPASFLGDPEKKVLDHYVAKLNAAGGVLGKQIELIVYDDGSATDQSATFTKRLIDNDGVDAIIGGTSSSASLAMIPLVEEAEIPFMSLAGAVTIIDPVKPWTFKVVHTDRMAAHKLFQEMKDKGITKIGMLSENAGYGKSGQEEAHKAAGEYGIEIVADEFYGPRDTDVTPQLTRIKNTPGVEAVLTWGIGQTAAIVVRNYRQLGFEQQLYHTHGVVSPFFIELAGAAAEGLRLTAAPIVVADQLPEDHPQRQFLIDFKNEYESTFNEGVSTPAGHAYDGLMLIVEAMERAGSVDKAAVRDEIEKTDGFIGIDGIFTFSPEDHLGLTLDSLVVVEIRDGNWTLTD